MTRPTADLVVLAYSGGLDTTVTVHRLVHEQGRAVVALLADVGQGEDLPALAQRALAAGATDAVVVDARDRFAAEFLVPAVRANALYEGRYPLVSALSRPLIAQLLVEEARRLGAGAVAHGCTGKGNDQVRFEVSCGALAPELEILAPVRDSAMSRPEAISYADKHGLDLGWITEAKPWSVDQNLWGRTVEAGVLEDPWLQPPPEAFEWTADPATASGTREVVVGFEAGVPATVDGEEAGLAGVVAVLNRLGGEAGFGRVDMMENRRVGIKSREVYEVPGALAVIAAHRDLEDLTLDRDVLHEKARLDIRYAELVYDGLAPQGGPGRVRGRDPAGRHRRGPPGAVARALPAHRPAGRAGPVPARPGHLRQRRRLRPRRRAGVRVPVGPARPHLGPGPRGWGDSRPLWAGGSRGRPTRACGRTPRRWPSTGASGARTWPGAGRMCAAWSRPGCWRRARASSCSTAWPRSRPSWTPGRSRSATATRTSTAPSSAA